MPINNEDDSYTSGYGTLEFLWAISKHNSDGFVLEAQSSPFTSFFYMGMDLSLVVQARI